MTHAFRARMRVPALIVAATAAVLGGAIAAAPAQAATCTITPANWDDLRIAFSSAPATGAVICLGADITRVGTGNGSTDFLDVPSGASVTFDLNGHDLLMTLPADTDTYAGISVSTGESITIDATGGGSLDISLAGGGAGIGSPANQDAGTITINGGTITATSGYDGAGIGGGSYGNGGNIIINGGQVTGRTTNCGAGIGSGEYSSNLGSVNIHGGTITATGSCGSPGIGGASGVTGGIVNITGGVVVATGSQGAAIGGGFVADGGTITISGGDVTAITDVGIVGSGGAAIGSGAVPVGQPLRAPGTLILIGAGTPTIGSGSNLTASSPTATVQAGPPGVTFTQTTVNGDATSTRAYTRIVFAVATLPVITTPSVPNGTNGTAYSSTIAATGTGPITFAVTSGTLPAGLTLDPATGVISGTPTGSGTSTFEVTATNSAGSDTETYTIVIPTVSSPSATPTPEDSESPESSPEESESPSSTTPSTSSAGIAATATTAVEQLAETGADHSGAAGLAAAGILMLVAGAAVLVATRRRAVRLRD